MTRSRQLRLGAFMRPVSIHTGAWRYPGAFPDANFNFSHYKRFAQTLAPRAPVHEHLGQVAATASEDVEIASMRIAVQTLLNL